MKRRGVDRYVWKFRQAFELRARVILWLIVMLLWWWIPPPITMAAPTFSYSPTAGTGNTNAPVTGSFTPAVGDIIICTLASAAGATAVNSITASTATIVAMALPACIRNSSPAEELWVLFVTAISGATTLTANLSATDQCVFNASGYAGAVGVGIGNSSAPATTANPSISVTRNAADSITVAGFSANTNAAFTAGTGNLRNSGTSSTVVGGAIVDNAGDSCSVTHASATWGIGIVELYGSAEIQLGNGVNGLAGTGTNGYVAAFDGNYDGVSFTTGGNAGGYTLLSAHVITNAAGSTGNLRSAVYDNTASPNRVRIVDSGASLAFGTPAGTGTPNQHVQTISATLNANTTYVIMWNNDTATIAYRMDDTTGAAGITDRFRAVAFGAAPNPLGAETTETFGPHMYVTMVPISSGDTLMGAASL